MTRKELQKVREMTVVNVMDLLRRGKINKSTTNQEVLNIVWDELPAHALRLKWENLEEILSLKCVKRIYKDDRGKLKADVKKNASGLMYEASWDDIIVSQFEGDEQSEYGIVLPSEENASNNN